MNGFIGRMGVGALALAAAWTAWAKDIDVVAVYYPHWHKYPKGIEWFGKTWEKGEWAFVKDAPVRFPGQINVKPAAGYLDGADPVDVETEIALASNVGIDVFLYDYYWYNGEKTQEEAIEQGFLKAKNRDRMKFALMWCFHERVDSFRPAFDATADKRRRLMSLARTPEEFLGLIDYSIANYFPAKEYWRKNGKLFFSIYNARDFVESLGADKARAALAQARAKVRTAGLGELEFNAQNPPNPAYVTTLKDIGFDSVTHYGCNAFVGDRWVRYCKNGERFFNFGDFRETLLERQEQFAKADLPYYPVVPTGWDSTLRCRKDVAFPWKHDRPNYPYCGTVTNNVSSTFEQFLRDAKAAVEKDPKKPGVVYINAWNEYTEGCWLLPDFRRSDGKLRAIARVFGRSPANEFVYTQHYPYYRNDNTPTMKAKTIATPDIENAKYGPHERQGMDVWLADKAVTGGRKTPAVIVIHGGGWTMGDRIPGAASWVPLCRSAGVTVVSINYRLIQDARDEGIKPPVKACVDDAVDAINYVKAHADEWNVDVTRLGLTGGSAGACSSLYASLVGDCSLGIRAVFTQSPQTSLDPQEMKAWIPNSRYGAHAFDYRNFNDWLEHRAECLDLVNRYSPAALLRACTASKAPVFLYSCAPDPKPGELAADPTHSPVFCLKFKELCEAKGIRCRRATNEEFVKALAE